MKWFWRIFVVLLVTDVVVAVMLWINADGYNSLRLEFPSRDDPAWVLRFSQFWEQVVILIAINATFLLVAYLNIKYRYIWTDSGFIFDKITGKAYPIEDRIGKEKLDAWGRIVAKFKEEIKSIPNKDMKMLIIAFLFVSLVNATELGQRLTSTV